MDNERVLVKHVILLMILSIEIHPPCSDISWKILLVSYCYEEDTSYNTIKVYLHSCESTSIKQNYFYQVHEHSDIHIF